MVPNPTKETRRRTRVGSFSSLLGCLGLTFAVGTAYFVAEQVSLAVLAKSDGVTLFWIAGGVSSGTLVVFGRSARWPVACGVTIATIFASSLRDRNIWISASFALCNVGETLLVAQLIERYFGLPFSLDRVRNVLGLLMVAATATAVSGVAATAAYKVLQEPEASFWTTWQHWFGSGSIGIITVAPLVIGLSEALKRPPPRGEIIEGFVALVALTAVMIVIIILLPQELWEMVAPVALLFPILWLAARCQPLFAATAAFIASFTIVWAVTVGIVHFGDPALPSAQRIVGTQIAILGVGICAYILAALFAERRLHETVIEKSEARLQEALTTGGVMAFECNPSGGVTKRSENATQILGLDPHETFTNAQFFARIHPQDRARYMAHHRRGRADSPATTIFRFVRPDNQEVWLEQTSRAEFDASGHLVSIKGLTRDITGRKQAEKRQDLLSAELDHRVKNSLARVAALVEDTQRGSRTMVEFVEALHGRLRSMAAAHTLLSQSRWSGVGLAELIHRQLAPYAIDENTSISGPEVTLTSAQTQVVAMVIHELVTNAAKHGALSSQNGSVSVNWDRASILTIKWRELGGPPIVAPIRSGYGSKLIREAIPYELGGAVELTFQVDGVCCKIEIPLQARPN
jgi:PAS domain S-box-containing protein